MSVTENEQVVTRSTLQLIILDPFKLLYVPLVQLLMISEIIETKEYGFNIFVDVSVLCCMVSLFSHPCQSFVKKCLCIICTSNLKVIILTVQHYVIPYSRIVGNWSNFAINTGPIRFRNTGPSSVTGVA